MLEHGGRLRAAAQRYSIPLSDWLDLSTGINPHGWPIPEIPPSLWSRLPENDDGLESAARSYYGSKTLLAVAGSQAAIQALPRLRSRARVGVLDPAYAEHAHAWRRAGHQVIAAEGDALDDIAAETDVLVLINPNNPTGKGFAPDKLLDWHARLAARGGWLVVDEAFVDSTPHHSLAPYCQRPGLFVLRSLGKFFGMPGARLGFVLAERQALQRLAEELGPWTVSSPARWLATRALADHAWQAASRDALKAAGRRLATLLTSCGLPPTGGCTLFQWVKTARAVELQEQLARQAILVRRFDEPASLRFGLPGEQADWDRLEASLRNLDLIQPDGGR